VFVASQLKDDFYLHIYQHYHHQPSQFSSVPIY